LKRSVFREFGAHFVRQIPWKLAVFQNLTIYKAKNCLYRWNCAHNSRIR
jgi:hypothetical protein